MKSHRSAVFVGPVGLLIGLSLGLGLGFAATSAQAAEPANFASEIKDLGASSTSVIIGSIERREIDVTETKARVRVVQSFAGPLQEGQSITFITRSGRVQVDKSEPDLTGLDRAVFFLEKDSDKDIYRCVQAAYGFKPIIHDNVYTNPQNPLETVKLKKYRESLTTLLKLKSTLPPTAAGSAQPTSNIQTKA